MEKLITLAGGENAINEFDDFKPLTPEAVVKANPDILFLFKSGLMGAGGNEAVLKMPGSCTNQCRKKKKLFLWMAVWHQALAQDWGEAVVELNKLLIENTK